VVKLPISVGADQKATVLERQSLASGVGPSKQLHQLGDTPLARPGTRMLAALGVSFVLGIVGARFLFDSTLGGTASEARETSTVPLPSSNVAAMRDAAATLPKPAQGADTLDRPLPPLDAPLAEVVDVLRERARNGDAESACRLAAEYALCASVPRQLGDYDRFRSAIERENAEAASPEGLRYVEKARRHIETDLDYTLGHCAGVEQASPAQLARYWLQAAKAGNLPAMKMFASGNAFRRDRLLDLLPELAEYKVLAESMAIKVANAGSQRMMFALAIAYLPPDERLPNLRAQSAGAEGISLLSQSVTQDRAKSIALLRHILSTMDVAADFHPLNVSNRVKEMIRTIEPLLDDGERARADTLFADYQKDWKPFGADFVLEPDSLGDDHVPSTRRASCGEPW
jgi:hypothetical protein